MEHSTRGYLQADNETVHDEFKQVVLSHPSIKNAEKRIEDLEAQVNRLIKYIIEIDKGMVIKKTNEEGDLEYVRF